MKKLRSYQVDGAKTGAKILEDYGIWYAAWGVRTGKTATSLEACRLIGFNHVLFLTKKKAVKGILSDYIDFGFEVHFKITVTNNESMHKLDPNEFDVVVHDESHRFGSIPKPSSGAKTFRQMFGHLPMIMLSGTPTPENFSQMFHQMWVSHKSPWGMYKNFYRWADDYVNVKQKKINSFMINDYTSGIEDKIMGSISHLMTTYTQEEAGFKAEIDEEVLHVDMKPITYILTKKLLNDLVVEGSEEVILADTSAKLMQKLHQLYSGTIKFESGNSKTIDDSKAVFIREKFKGLKIGIFYVFKEELTLLKAVFGEDLTTDIDEFNSTDKSIALQVVSGREGISLYKASYLVFYNIQHSATSYWQARDRLTTMDRPSNKVFWVFSNGGIEDKIYKVVKSKKKYTLNIFKKDYGVK